MNYSRNLAKAAILATARENCSNPESLALANWAPPPPIFVTGRHRQYGFIGFITGQ
jgi:hypothetical protein